MTYYGFTDAWYAGRLNQEEAATPENTSPDAAEIGRSIRFGACVIAQAIDNAFTKDYGESGRMSYFAYLEDIKLALEATENGGANDS